MDNYPYALLALVLLFSAVGKFRKQELFSLAALPDVQSVELQPWGDTRDAESGMPVDCFLPALQDAQSTGTICQHLGGFWEGAG